VSPSPCPWRQSSINLILKACVRWGQVVEFNAAGQLVWLATPMPGAIHQRLIPETG